MMIKELTARLALFKNKNYACFCLSGFCATLGAGFSYVALSFYAYHYHGGLTGTIAIFLCWWLPSVLLAPVIGVITDRYSRQWLIVLSNVVRGVAIFGFVASLIWDLGIDVLWLAVVQGAFNSLYMPAAIPLIYQLVDEKVLLRANATIDIIYELGFILGLGVSGLLLLWFGMQSLLVLCGSLMLVSGLILCLLKGIAHQQNPPKHLAIWQDYKRALIYIKATPSLHLPYAMQAVIKVLMMCIPVLLLPYVNEVLKQDTQVFAYFEMAIACGAIVGGLISPMVSERFGEMGALRSLLGCVFVGLLGMAMNDYWQFGLLIYLLVGVGLASWAVAVTRSQTHCLPDFQGRLQSMVEAVSGVVILVVFGVMTCFEKSLSIAMMYVLLAFVALVGLLLAFAFDKAVYSLSDLPSQAKSNQQLNGNRPHHHADDNV